MENMFVPILLGVLNILAGVLLLAAKLLYGAVQALQNTINELRNSLVWVTNCKDTHRVQGEINKDHEDRIRANERDIERIKAREE